MSCEDNTFLLALGSPRRTPTALVDAASATCAGAGLSSRRGVGLSAFLDGDEEAEAEESVVDEERVEGRGKKVKRKSSRIARPRDAMPGFRRSRGGGGRRGGGGGAFRGRGNANGNVGKRYLDRELSAAKYFGKELIVDEDVGTGVGAADLGARVEMGVVEMSFVEPEEKELTICALPSCHEHGRPCAKFKCKKRGRNKGREFFKCSHPARHHQCEFFMWADDVKDFFSANATDDIDVCSSAVVAPPAVGPEVIGNVMDECAEDGAKCDGDELDLDAVLESVFGFSDFRVGQRSCIERLLHGQSALALLPTGAGKSLIYQTFAAVRPGVVVVITPLISLMLDQLAGLPDCIQGACLRSGQKRDVTAAVERRVRAGEIKVLFVSPERLFSARFRKLMTGPGAPLVSLVAVDEAHCISQWSHNFRTSYLRLPTVLFAAHQSGIADVPIFGTQPLVLALTATATMTTVSDICKSLNIDMEEGVVRSDASRDNLTLTLSRVDGPVDSKAQELVRRLRAEPFRSLIGIADGTALQLGTDVSSAAGKTLERGKTSVPGGARDRNELSVDNAEAGHESLPVKRRKLQRVASGGKRVSASEEKMTGWGAEARPKRKRVKTDNKPHGSLNLGKIIVYVSKQRECETVCNYLRSSTLQMSGKIAMYHAGMPLHDRNKVQEAFDKGTVRVLVATIAFGMGLDNPNVRGVIHFDMPFSLEAYAQEIGRAGRDGREAACHAFFNTFDGQRLCSRTHSDGVELSTVRKFLLKLLASRKRSKQVAVSTKRKQAIAVFENPEPNSGQSDEDEENVVDDEDSGGAPERKVTRKKSIVGEVVKKCKETNRVDDNLASDSEDDEKDEDEESEDGITDERVHGDKKLKRQRKQQQKHQNEQLQEGSSPGQPNDMDAILTDKDGVLGRGSGDKVKEHAGDDCVLFIRHSVLERELDVRPETAETICAFLEAQLPGLSMLQPSHTVVHVQFFSKSPQALLEPPTGASTPTVIGAAERRFLTTLQQHGKMRNGKYELALPAIGLNEESIIGPLLRLRAARHITFELRDIALYVACTRDTFLILEEKIQEHADLAARRLLHIENLRRAKADAVFDTLVKADEMLSDAEQSLFLHQALSKYFDETTNPRLLDSPSLAVEQIDAKQRTKLAAAVRQLLKADSFGAVVPRTPRQICRILHGIQSPAFTAKNWCRCDFWGRFVHIDFRAAKLLASEVVRAELRSRAPGRDE